MTTVDIVNSFIGETIERIEFKGSRNSYADDAMTLHFKSGRKLTVGARATGWEVDQAFFVFGERGMDDDASKDFSLS